MNGSPTSGRTGKRSAWRRSNSDLKLRVHGTRRDGQIISVSSPSCSIGSNPDCTIRLSGAGVEPVHCLIVRGPRATVVRRWGHTARLNGRRFTDAEVHIGDRLAVGDLEFEFFENLFQEESAPEHSAIPDRDHSPSEFCDSDRGQSLTNDMASILNADAGDTETYKDRIATLELARQIRDTRIRRLTQELRTSRKGSAELEALALRHERQVEELVGKIRQLQSQLEDVPITPTVQPIGTGTVSFAECGLRPVEGPSEESTDFPAGQHPDIENEREQWRSEREVLESELTDLQHLHDRQRQEHDQLLARIAAAEERVVESDERQQQLESELAEAQAIVQQTEQLHQELQRSSDELSANQDRLQELQLKVEQLETEQARASSEQRGESELQERQRLLAQASYELETEKAAFQKEQSSWEERCSRCEREIMQVEQKLHDKAEELTAERAALADERVRLEQQFADLEREAEQYRSQVDRPNAGANDEVPDGQLVGHTAQWSPGQTEPLGSEGADRDENGRLPESADVPDSSSSSVESVDRVLASYRSQNPEPDDSDGVNQASSEHEDTTSRLDNSSTVVLPEPMPTPNDTIRLTDVARQEADDESIENYMARLLKRVHGDNVQPASSAAQDAVQLGAADHHEIDTEPASDRDASTPIGASQFLPRHQPPEQSKTLDAMRELANQSARQAIKSSDRRRKSTALRQTSLIAVTGMLVGLTLIYVGTDAVLLSVCGAAVSIIAAIVWGVKAFRMRKQYPANGSSDESSTESAVDPLADQAEKVVAEEDQ